jgi:hypothetical protein
VQYTAGVGDVADMSSRPSCQLEGIQRRA